VTKIEYAILMSLTMHMGQKDRAGEDYILHPMEVCSIIKNNLTNVYRSKLAYNDITDEDIISTAMMHDIIEDSDLTLETLRAMNIFGQDVVDAIGILTKDDSVSYDDYIKNIAKNKIAIVVKIADLKHNSDLTRLKKVSAKDLERNHKYIKSHKYLMECLNERI